MQLTIGRRLVCGFAAVLALVGLMFMMTNRATRDLREAHRQLGDALRDSARVQVEAATLDRWSEALGEARAGLTESLNGLRDAVLNNAPHATLFPAAKPDVLGALLGGDELAAMVRAVPEAQARMARLKSAHEQLRQVDKRIGERWRPRHAGLAEALDGLKRTQLYWTLKVANMLFVKSGISELLYEELTDTPLEEFRHGPVYERFASDFPALAEALDKAAPANARLWDASYELAGLIMESHWEKARLLYRDVFPPAVKSMLVDLDGVLAEEQRILADQQQVVAWLDSEVRQPSEEALAALTELQGLLENLTAAKSRALRTAAGTLLDRDGIVARKLAGLQHSNLVLTLIVVALSALAGWWITRSITRPLDLTVGMIRDLEGGRLDRRLELNRQDELGQMARALDTFAGHMRDEVMGAFDHLAIGDFTFAASGPIHEPLHKANIALSGLILRMRQAGDQVAAGAAQIAQASQDLSHGTVQQASSLEDITAGLGETARQAHDNAERAAQSTRLTDGLARAASSGQQQMHDMVTAMDQIRQATQDIARVIKMIDEIAFQTNLLALNASVEAARAGSHGKGFAVVAEEVRNLAARSARAAQETSSMIQDTLKKVQLGSEVVASTDQALQQIGQGVGEVKDLADEIAAASDEQAGRIAHVNRQLARIDEVVQQNASSSTEAAASAEQLAGWADELHRMLGDFQLQDHSALKLDEPEALRLLPGSSRQAA
jgi:methyl-accepting chemotaxis protein